MLQKRLKNEKLHQKQREHILDSRVWEFSIYWLLILRISEIVCLFQKQMEEAPSYTF